VKFQDTCTGEWAEKVAGDAKAACGLTKEYVNGTLTFRDTCTGESEQRDKAF
jgi:hypothetical protein